MKSLLAVLLTAAGFYALNFGDFFVSDDFVALEGLGQSSLKDLVSGTNIAGLDAYRPLTLISMQATKRIFGLRPAAYRMQGVFWFALCAGLIYALSFFITKRNPFTAALAAAAFVLHPAHAENVAYISGAPPMAATALTLLSVYFLLRRTESPRIIDFVFAFLAGSAAGFVHESGWVAPLVMAAAVLFDPVRPGDRKFSVTSLAPCAAALIVIIAVRASVCPGMTGVPFAGRPGLYMARNFLRYLQMALLPMPTVDLTGIAARQRAWLFPLSAAALAASIFLARRIFKSAGARLTAALFVLGFLPFAGHFPRDGAMPLMTAALAFGIGLSAQKILELPRRRSVAFFSVACAWIVFLGSMSGVQAARWHNAAALSRKLVTTFPSSALCRDGPANVAVLTAPDTLRGAFVLRNGLHQALVLFGPRCYFQVERFLLAGLSEPTGKGLGCWNTEPDRYEIATSGRGPYNYLLLPDARMDRHKGMIVKFGPAFYRILGEDRPYAVDSVELGFDPAFLAGSDTSIVVFQEGAFRPFDKENP